MKWRQRFRPEEISRLGPRIDGRKPPGVADSIEKQECASSGESAAAPFAKSSPMHNKKSPPQQAGEVLLLRIRVATAESRLNVLREQARQAKRRRKEAKRLAQHARKQVKRSKADLSDLRAALARAEAKIFKAAERALAGKLAKPGSVTKTNAQPAKKSKASARRPSPASTRLPRTLRSAPRKKSAPRRITMVFQNPADAVALEPNPSTLKIIDDRATIYEQRNPDQGIPKVEDQKI